MHDLDPGPWLDDFRLLVHPAGCGGRAEVLVAVHGISRNAAEILEAFRARAGGSLTIVAPRFGGRQFPDFQRLGLYGRGLRADLALDAALERCSAVTGADTARFHLFGFSGGAQFAHRYAMLHPHRIRSLHVASAGWYTMPDPDLRWPYGLGARRLARPMIRNLALFRRLPKHVYAGGGDTERDEALRKNPVLDRLQGRNRLERAERWAGAVGAESMTVIEGAGHDFMACCAPGKGPGLADLVLAGIAERGAPAGQGLDREAMTRP